MTPTRARARSGAGHVRRRPCPASCAAPDHSRCARGWEWRFSHAGRVFTGSGRTEREAHAALRVAQAEAAAGRLLSARERRERERREREAAEAVPTLAAYAGRYLERRTSLRPRTVDSYRAILELHLLPALGTRRIDSITRRDIRELLDVAVRPDQDGRVLTAATLSRIRSLASAIFKAAVDDELVASNPAAGVRLPESAATGRAGQIKAATPAQTAAMLARAAGHDLCPIARFIAATGVRRSEACALRWERVDLDAGVAVIAEGLHQRGGVVSVTPPKSKAGARTLHLDAETLTWLRAHRREQAQASLLFGRERFNPSGYVFTRADGTPVRPDSLTAAVQRWFREAGAPGLGVHSLRHGWATAALAVGADVRVVSEALGHSTTTLTRDVYQHTPPELARQASELIAALRRQAAGD